MGKKSRAQRCQICGCTEADSGVCVERTGEPCHWVEEDLCSACLAIAAFEGIAGLGVHEACRRVETLSPRELQVLELVALGKTSREIWEALGVCRKTLDVHRFNAKRKLGEASIAGLPRHWHLYRLYRPIAEYYAQRAEHEAAEGGE